jgi:hypothetical protein
LVPWSSRGRGGSSNVHCSELGVIRRSVRNESKPPINGDMDMDINLITPFLLTITDIIPVNVLIASHFKVEYHRIDLATERYKVALLLKIEKKRKKPYHKGDRLNLHILRKIKLTFLYN